MYKFYISDINTRHLIYHITHGPVVLLLLFLRLRHCKSVKLDSLEIISNYFILTIHIFRSCFQPQWSAHLAVLRVEETVIAGAQTLILGSFVLHASWAHKLKLHLIQGKMYPDAY